MNFRFQDRYEAGRSLAKELRHYQGRPEVVVLALPRGGVPVAFEVAQKLKTPLDVFTVRKLGVPGHEELAMGAIATGGVFFLNDDVVRSLDIPQTAIDKAIAREKLELARREETYRHHDQPLNLRDRTVILVDDGLATGASMHAAVNAVKQHRPRRVVVGVPVAAETTRDEFEDYVDEIICVQTPDPFFAVGEWYEDFSQTSDEEVRDLLDRASQVEKSMSAPTF